MQIIIGFSLSMVLAGCGGSGSIDSTIALDGQTIQVEAEVWEAVSMLESPVTHDFPCSELVVLGSFSANPGPFPKSITVQSVQLLADGKAVWRGQVDAKEIRPGPDDTLVAPARDCFPAALKVDGRVTAVFEITGAQGGARIAAPEVTITQAF